MSHPSRRIIVGAAGSANCFGTIQSVRDHFGDSVFVVAIDTNRREFAAASLLADAFVQMPIARSPEFPEALHRLAASYPSSCYLPLHDEEIEAAARLAAEGRLPAGLELIAPPYEMVRLCSDKWKMHHWLRANGLCSPETAPATPAAFRRREHPAILKPREGTGSRGVRLIDDEAALVDIDGSQWLVQEQLKGPEIAVDVFLSRRTGAFICACREYIEVRATVAMKVRILHDPSLAETAENLARRLPLYGAFVFQVMRDAASRWKIIDVNPRVGSGTRMCAAVGLDFAAANLADFWGDPTEPMLQALDGEHYVVRQYADYVTSRSFR
jgi:carbamoylphosphate synthase large subunit